MRLLEKKNVISNLGYCIQHTTQVSQFEKLYIPNRYMTNVLSMYAWSHDIFTEV